MLDVQLLRNDLDGIAARLATRGMALDANTFRDLEESRRRVQTRTQELQALRNASSKKIGELKKKGGDTAALMAEMAGVGEQLKTLETELADIQSRLEQYLLGVPNVPHPSVPVGKSSNDNVEVRRSGGPRRFDFPVWDHVDVGAGLGMLDFEGAAKIAGARFVVMTGALARLHRAIAQFMLDVHTREHGYEEHWVPVVVNRESMTGTGQLPKFAEDMYTLRGDDGYLIPTAEVPLTNLFRDEIVAESDLPRAITGYSPCFRREAGAAGKDTRGLLRVHEFDKVELVRFVTPESSNDQLELLTGHAEKILQLLELPYRVVRLAAGDTGFASAHTYDLETFAPGVGKWLEVSSCSNFTDFQARRANIRYKPAEGGKPRFVHTLNGSGLAFPRVIASILEHHQQEDGSVRVPAALATYLGAERLG